MTRPRDWDRLLLSGNLKWYAVQYRSFFFFLHADLRRDELSDCRVPEVLAKMLLPTPAPVDFWSVPSASDIQNGLLDLLPSVGGKTSVNLDRCTPPTQSRQSKICFINPLFLQLEVKSKVSGGVFCTPKKQRNHTQGRLSRLNTPSFSSPPASDCKPQCLQQAEPLQAQHAPPDLGVLHEPLPGGGRVLLPFGVGGPARVG